MLHGCADLRLAVVSPFVDRRHGTERALAELLERLARTYHCEIHLYSNRVEDLSVNNSGGALPPGTGGIFWHKVPSVPGPHLLQFLCWFYLNRLWRWAHTFFRGSSFDLVLSPGINSSDADVVIVHALFHRLRELLQEKAMSASLGLGLLSRVHRRAYYALLTALERRIYANPKVSLAAVSRHTATQLRKYFGRHEIPVIPNGVDTSVFSPSARASRRETARLRLQFAPHDRVLLLIGNDWRTKGLPALLEAVARCREFPLRICVVGNEDPSSYSDSLARLQLTSRVSFSPPVEDVLDFYAAADFYVAPSKEDSFNLPALEAMACGLPVIVSTCAGISEYIHDRVDGILLLNPEDPGELAAVLRRFLMAPELMQTIGENASRTASELSWDRHAAAIHNLIRGFVDLDGKASARN